MFDFSVHSCCAKKTLRVFACLRIRKPRSEYERFSKGDLEAGPSTVPCVESYLYRLHHDGWWWMIEGARGGKVIQWTTPRKRVVWLQTESGSRVSCKWPPLWTTISMTAAPATSWWARWRCTGEGPGCYMALSSRFWRFYTQAGCTCG